MSSKVRFKPLIDPKDEKNSKTIVAATSKLALPGSQSLPVAIALTQENGSRHSIGLQPAIVDKINASLGKPSSKPIETRLRRAANEANTEVYNYLLNNLDAQGTKFSLMLCVAEEYNLHVARCGEGQVQLNFDSIEQGPRTLFNSTGNQAYLGSNFQVTPEYEKYERLNQVSGGHLMTSASRSNPEKQHKAVEIQKSSTFSLVDVGVLGGSGKQNTGALDLSRVVPALLGLLLLGAGWGLSQSGQIGRFFRTIPTASTISTPTITTDTPNPPTATTESIDFESAQIAETPIAEVVSIESVESSVAQDALATKDAIEKTAEAFAIQSANLFATETAISLIAEQLNAQSVGQTREQEQTFSTPAASMPQSATIVVNQPVVNEQPVAPEVVPNAPPPTPFVVAATPLPTEAPRPTNMPIKSDFEEVSLSSETLSLVAPTTGADVPKNQPVLFQWDYQSILSPGTGFELITRVGDNSFNGLFSADTEGDPEQGGWKRMPSGYFEYRKTFESQTQIEWCVVLVKLPYDKYREYNDRNRKCHKESSILIISGGSGSSGQSNPSPQAPSEQSSPPASTNPIENDG